MIAFILLALLSIVGEASAMDRLTTLVTHCPSCDTTVTNYNSSAWERWQEAGKYQEGNGQYPYRERESAIQGDNQERKEQRRESWQDNSGGQYGGDICRSLYGCYLS